MIDRMTALYYCILMFGCGLGVGIGFTVAYLKGGHE